MANRKTMRELHPMLRRSDGAEIGGEQAKPTRVKTTVHFTREAWIALKELQLEAERRGERAPDMSDLVSQAILLLREQASSL
jgi:hypothetical protein